MADNNSEKNNYLKLGLDRIILLGYYGTDLDIMNFMLREKTNVKMWAPEDGKEALTRYRIMTLKGERILWFTNLNVQFNDLIMDLKSGEEIVDRIRKYESKKTKSSYVVACSGMDSYGFKEAVENHDFDESMNLWELNGIQRIEEVLLNASNYFRAA